MDEIDELLTKCEEFQVTVSISMSKTLTVKVPNPGYWEGDKFISEKSPITEKDVRLEHYLPDEILDIISKGRKIDQLMVNDSKDWIVDELVVTEE
jgi:hypothetical protein